MLRFLLFLCCLGAWAGDQPPAKSLTIPDVNVVDQTGKQLRFYQDLVAGKVVAMNFIFTTCPTICPPMGANFARLQQELKRRKIEDVVLISVSINPTTDTPERLAAWAAKFDPQPGWTLVTGPKQDITVLLKAIKTFSADILNHTPTVLLGNEARDVWQRTNALAPPGKLADLLVELRDGQKPLEAGGR